MKLRSKLIGAVLISVLVPTISVPMGFAEDQSDAGQPATTDISEVTNLKLDEPELEYKPEVALVAGDGSTYRGNDQGVSEGDR